MKKALALIMACLSLLIGCGQSKPSGNLPPKNFNGTQTLMPLDEQAGTASGSGVNVSHETSVAPPSGDLVEIREKLFVAQTNDIYYNSEDYLGKTIKYEGIFDIYQDPETGNTYYSVIRYGPGCCGVDANAGFEVVWERDYPAQNDWVEAVGILEAYEEDGWPYLRLQLSSLTVLPTRGAESVQQ